MNPIIFSVFLLFNSGDLIIPDNGDREFILSAEFCQNEAATDLEYEVCCENSLLSESICANEGAGK